MQQRIHAQKKLRKAKTMNEEDFQLDEDYDAKDKPNEDNFQVDEYKDEA